MKSKLVILIITLFSAINSQAIPLVRNPQLSNLVAQGEILRTENKQFEAAAMYLDAINIKNPNAQRELKEIKSPDNSPYGLRLHLIRLLCLEKAGERTSSTFEKECRIVINKYKNQAKGKLWPHYIAVYQQLINHYSELHKISAFNNTLFEILDAEPRYLPFLSYFFINSNFSKLAPSRINAVIEKYENSDARIYPSVKYLKLIIADRFGSNSFAIAYDFIKKYPRFENINEVVKILENSVDKSKPEQLKKYKNALVVLAIKQPYKKDDTSQIAFIINKINK